MSRPRESGAERICIVLLTGLGDVVNGLPLANALKDQNPDRHITWVAEPVPAQILQHHAAVDEVIVYRKKDGLKGVLDLRGAMAGREFDLTINLMIYGKSVWPTLLSRAPRRVGFGRDRARDLTWLAANRHLPAGPKRHTVDLFLEFAEHLGVPVPAVEWRIVLTEEERDAQRRFFAAIDRPVVIIPPASAMPPKDWLADRWTEVVDALEHDFGYRVVLVGGRGARETEVARVVLENTRGQPISAVGDDAVPVREMAWMIDGADLMIAPDTGPLHLSRALDTPVIGLYGHTNPYRVGPYRKYQDLWIDTYTEPGEDPDASHADPRSGRMEMIAVADVLDRVELARRRYLGGTAVPDEVV